MGVKVAKDAIDYWTMSIAAVREGEMHARVPGWHASMVHAGATLLPR